MIPDPLPQIHNKCVQNAADVDCVLNVSTVSEESFDPVAATEIKTKLMSRQSIILAATGQKLGFKVTDGDNRCALINNQAMTWALGKLPKQTLNRYLEKGKKMEIGSDIDMSDLGPIWIWAPIVRIRKMGLTDKTFPVISF